MVAKTPEDLMHRTNKSVSNSHRLLIEMSFFDGDSGKLPNFGLLLPIKLIRAELVNCRLLIRIFYHETQKHGKFYVTNVSPYLSLSLFFLPGKSVLKPLAFPWNVALSVHHLRGILGENFSQTVTKLSTLRERERNVQYN